MLNWKLIGGFSLFGALVSLIAGLAGGNPFGVILLRLILSALLFGGLGFGVLSLFKKFFPDLLGSPAASEEKGNVDIVLDEEVALGEPEISSGQPQPVFSQAEGEVAGQQKGPAEELAGVELPEPAEAEVQPSETQNLDSLPEIESFNAHFATSSPPGGSDDLRRAQVDSLVKGQDPAKLAKAIRTVLKRDQQG